jgi:hypothetical protein
MPRGARKYPVPDHISKLGISQEAFGRWLDRVTNAQIVRDRKRTGARVLAELYRQAIHRAVCDGGDLDYYTGEPLDWRLLRYFSKGNGVGRDCRLLPTVDHEGLSANAPIFRICSLRTNKCKSDYSVMDLLNFCQAFIRHQRRKA